MIVVSAILGFTQKTLPIKDVTLINTEYVYGEYGHELIMANGNGYLTANNRGLLILNLDDVDNPTIIGNYTVKGAQGLVIQGNIVYFMAYQAGLVILNTSNPSQPQLIANYTKFASNTFAIDGNMIFTINYTSKNLLCLDATNLKNITIKGSEYLTQYSSDMQIITQNHMIYRDWETDRKSVV